MEVDGPHKRELFATAPLAERELCLAWLDKELGVTCP